MPVVSDHPPVICEVINQRDKGIATIFLQITASKDVAGLYRLTVKKRDSSGRVDLQQGGAFSLARGKRQDIGVIKVGVSGEGFLGIEATVRADGKDIRCDKHEIEHI